MCKILHAKNIKCPQCVHTYLLSAVIPLPKMETEDYLVQSVGNILSILSKPKTQLPFLTYGYTTTSAVESIAKLPQRAISRAPPVIPNPDPTPKPERKIPVPKQFPINVPTISPTISTVPFRVQRVPIVSPTRPPVQVQRLPLQSIGETTIPAIKSIPPRPVCPSLNTLRHTCAAAVA